MAKKEILPAIEEYSAFVASSATAKKALDSAIPCTYETETVKKLSVLTGEIYNSIEALDDVLAKLQGIEAIDEEAYMIRDELILKMNELRVSCDEAEVITPEKFWPFPTYGELLFGVR